RPEDDRTRLMSRIVIRACVVAGVLLLVAAWRLDQAVGTAYATNWVAPRFLLTAQSSPACHGCWRLPGEGWIAAYSLAGSGALLLLGLAAGLYGLRRYSTIGSGVLVAAVLLGGITAVCAVAAVYLRYATGHGDANWEGLATIGELLGVSSIALGAVAVAVAKPVDGVT